MQHNNWLAQLYLSAISGHRTAPSLTLCLLCFIRGIMRTFISHMARYRQLKKRRFIIRGRMVPPSSNLYRRTRVDLNFLCCLFWWMPYGIDGVCPGTTAIFFLVTRAGHKTRVCGNGGTIRGVVSVATETLRRELESHVFVPVWWVLG